MGTIDSALPCKLDGRPCRGGACPFWARGECVLDDVDLRGRRDLVRWLLALRNELAREETVSPRGREAAQ